MGLSETLKAIADPRRRIVLELLRDGRHTASELASAMGLAPSAASYHLGLLRKANLVVEEHEGSHIYYELNASVFEDLLRWVYDLRGATDNDER